MPPTERALATIRWHKSGVQSWVVELGIAGLPTLHRYFVSEASATRCAESWRLALDAERAEVWEEAESLALLNMFRTENMKGHHGQAWADIAGDIAEQLRARAAALRERTP